MGYLDRKCGDVEELVMLQDQMIAELQAYKQSVITETVTRGLDPNAPLKDSGIEWIGQIPKHWKISAYKRCMNICNGQDYKHIIAESGFPVIGSGGQFAFATTYIYDGEVVFLGRKGTVNKPIYYNGKFWVVDTMFYSIPKDISFCKYMYYIATTFPFDKYSMSTALPSMTQNDLNNIIISIPPLSEQQAIANHLDEKCKEIDELITIKRQKIEELKEYRKSFIFECVTGKRQVV